VRHPLLDPDVVAAVEAAAARHRGRRWTAAGFADRASHPCGIFGGSPFAVFAKLDPAPGGAGRLTAELRGLRLIAERARAAVPVPVAGGTAVTAAGALLLTEALPERTGPRGAGDDAAIGRALATLHQARGQAFGLAEFDGFFGSLPQSNRPAASGRWAGFYAERRLLPMLALAAGSGHLPAPFARGTERLAARLESLAGPEPVPALLHGDAQQNNFLSTAAGAVLIDTAPYYGHPEADLALVDYVAPVGPALVRAYADISPVDAGFAGRRELWRLHAYLAVIAADGGAAFGRTFLPRLDAALRQYA
jgi:fructosamine-3-kinase